MNRSRTAPPAPAPGGPGAAKGPNAAFAGVAAAAALILSGLWFGASLWLLAGGVAVLLLGISSYLTRRWSTDVVAVRHTGDAEVRVGSIIPVRVEIINRGPMVVGWVLAEDLLPRWSMAGRQANLHVDGDRLTVLTLRGRQRRMLEYSIRCHRRGYFQIGPTVLETGDFLGLFRRYRIGTSPQYVTVLPAVQPLSGYDIASRRPIGEIKMRESVMDDPTRLRGIRRWQPGDPMRSIHWAATARTGTLHSKVYEPSSIAGATLVLDMHVASNPPQHEPVRGDLAVTAAASIAAALHDLGEPFGLLSNGRDAADRIRQEGWRGDHRVRAGVVDGAAMATRSDRLAPVVVKPDRGPIQLKDLLRRLARLEMTDGLRLPELLAESESQLSAETTLLVIVQTCDEAALSSLIGLSRRGWQVAVIINTHDINDYAVIAGPLIAVRIPVFHLGTADSITDVCRDAIRV